MSDTFIYEQKYSSPGARTAIEILSLLARSRSPLSTSEIARQLEISRSLAHRVLCELRNQRCVDRAYDRKYRLGLRVLELGGAYAGQLDFGHSVRLAMMEVSRLTGETTNFAMLEGAEVVYIMKNDSVNSVTTISLIGTRLPANCTALGKVMLARLSDEELAERLQDPLPQSTPRSLGTLAALRADLRVIRQHGYAIERGESLAGRSCVAVRVELPGQDSAISAMSVSMSEDVFLERHQAAVSHLLDARDRLQTESRARERLEGISGGFSEHEPGSVT
jgi:IclR family KDG regulon transcriptional repressor